MFSEALSRQEHRGFTRGNTTETWCILKAGLLNVFYASAKQRFAHALQTIAGDVYCTRIHSGTSYDASTKPTYSCSASPEMTSVKRPLHISSIHELKANACTMTSTIKPRNIHNPSITVTKGTSDLLRSFLVHIHTSAPVASSWTWISKVQCSAWMPEVQLSRWSHCDQQ